MTLIAQGHSIQEIAQKLHRSGKTIESHRLALGRKLKVSNRVELAKIAIANNLIQLSPTGPQTSNVTDHEVQWLDAINESIGNAVGGALIERFSRAASRLPGIRYAGVCTPAPEQEGEYNRLTISLTESGGSGISVRYNAVGTPCEQAINQGQCIIPEGIQERFPGDVWLKQIDAQSYIGIQFNGVNGQPLGCVGLVGCEPLTDTASLQRVISFFAPHISGALDVLKQIDAMQAQCDLLERQIEGIKTSAVPDEKSGKISPLSITLAQIASEVQPYAGPMFLRKILESISKTYSLTHAGICVLDPSKAKPTLRSVVFVVDGQVVDDIAYTTMNTPCEIALDKGYYSIPNAAGTAFPEDELLLKNQIDSYVGVRLTLPSGEVAGLLWMGNRGPIEETDAIGQISAYFAHRIGSELEQIQRFDALIEERERLEEQLQSSHQSAPNELPA